MLSPHRHSWMSGAMQSPCVLRRQYSERKVVVCPCHTHTLRTPFTTQATASLDAVGYRHEVAQAASSVRRRPNEMGRLDVHIHSVCECSQQHVQGETEPLDLPTAPSDRQTGQHTAVPCARNAGEKKRHEEGSKRTCGSRQRDLEAAVSRVRTTSKTKIPSNTECDSESTAHRTSRKASLDSFDMSRASLRPEKRNPAPSQMNILRNKRSLAGIDNAIVTQHLCTERRDP